MLCPQGHKLRKNTSVCIESVLGAPFTCKNKLKNYSLPGGLAVKQIISLTVLGAPFTCKNKLKDYSLPGGLAVKQNIFQSVMLP